MDYMNIQYTFINKMNYIDQIKNEGYCIIPQVLEPYQVEYLLLLIKEQYSDTKDRISQDVPYLNQNQPNVYNLQNKDINFTQTLLGLKEVEEILIHFLNDKWYKQIPQNQPNYILRSFGARSSNSALPLHIDSFIPYKGEEVSTMQVVIALENFTLDNGCTLVIPGSHLSGEYANEINSNKLIPLEAKAGDIIIWDSRIHHSTTCNKTNNTRWAMVATFCRWWIKQHFDITSSLPYFIYDNLTPKEKSILGFASIPPKTEFDAIEMKKGYEDL